jgi:hypothetical protein
MSVERIGEATMTCMSWLELVSVVVSCLTCGFIWGLVIGQNQR